MSGRLIMVLAAVLAVTALPLQAQPRDGDWRDRGDRDRAGDKSGQADKAPPGDRGLAKGPGGRGPGGGPMGRGKGPGSRPASDEGYGRGGMHRGHRPTVLTKEQEAELLKHIQQHQPELNKRIEDLRKRDERMYRHMLSRMWGYYRKLRDLPESLRKRIYAKEAARRTIYRVLTALKKVASSADKAKLMGELRQAVTVQFEAEQAEREYRLTLLAKQIDSIRAELKDRQAQRDEIIATRVESLLKIPMQSDPHGGPPRDGKDRPPPRRPED